MGKLSRLRLKLKSMLPIVCLCGVVLLAPKLWQWTQVKSANTVMEPIQTNLAWADRMTDRHVQKHKPAQLAKAWTDTMTDRHVQKHKHAQLTKFQVEIFPNWTTSKPHDRESTRRFYLYSAVVAIHATHASTHVHFVGFQDGPRIMKMTCCLKLSDSKKIYSGKNTSLSTSAVELTKSSSSVVELDAIAVVYYCRFPFTSHEFRNSRATLSRGSCPEDSGQFISVHQPEIRPGLAICARIASGPSLDPSKVVEWFELQKILGVDRVQLFDLGNSDAMYRVFRLYQDQGLLDLLPYKLPGRPWGRAVPYRGENQERYLGDVELAVWDCRLRLAGFDYVMGVDLNEVIVPRRHDALIPFLQDKFARRHTAASLHFKPQFFVQKWAAVDPGSPLMVLRYLNSTDEQSWAFRHVYLPERTRLAATHTVTAVEGFSRVLFVSNTEAALFHYIDTCEDDWPFDCETVEKRTDTAMMRFEDQLVPNVMSVRETLGLRLP